MCEQLEVVEWNQYGLLPSSVIVCIVSFCERKTKEKRIFFLAVYQLEKVILSAVYYVIDLESEFAGDIFADFSRKKVKITKNYCLEMILRITVCN